MRGSRGPCPIVLGLFILFFALEGSSAFGQRRIRRNIQPAIRRPEIKQPAAPLRPIELDASAPVANLLTRAEEGMRRGDWKFVIDCLQRVINDPEDSLIAWTPPEADGAELYESARRTALRKLASLPPEALNAYRLLHDGRAKRLFERGIDHHDIEALRKLTRRYLLTPYGVEGAHLLMSWALDAGRFGEVILLADDVLALAPTGDVARARIESKLAATYALLGRSEAAEALLSGIDAEGNDGKNLDRSVDLAAIVTLRPTAHDQDRMVSKWPTQGGSPARRGWMEPVDPTLSDLVPWWSALPGATTDAWRPVLVDDPDDPLHLPVGRLVSNGRNVFARTRRGCVALDLDDLATVWEARTRWGGERRVPRGRGRSRGSRDGMPTAGEAAFDDEVAGAISLGHDLVTIVVREGRGEYTLHHRDVRQGGILSWIPRPTMRSRNVQGSQIMAYDQSSGRLVWQRGRTSHPDDPLGDVEFMSVPLAVGDKFWVPYLRQDELEVGVLDPTDGALVHRISICSLGPRTSAVQRGLHLAAGDGMVFVPSDRGILFAIDSIDYSLRWASRYRDLLTEMGAAHAMETGGWLPSAPIVAGGYVLLAPRGQSELLAFSVSDGAPAWTALCPDQVYPIGADHEHVYLGGRRISCLAMCDGAKIWTMTVDSVPTGRAVRADTKLLVPTLRELVSLSASTGEVLARQSASLSHGALGNILSHRSALLSINPSSVRRFPDIGRTYPEARQRHDESPTDVKAAVRLAWLELLRGEPQRAFNVIDGLAPGMLQDGSRRADDAAHVRVEALLAMAGSSGQPDRSAEEVLALLEDANRAARRPEDRIRCTTAIADQLESLERPAEAFDRLWRLSISDDGGHMVSWLEHVDGTARFAIAARLRELAEKLTAQEFRRFRDQALASLGLTDETIGGRASTREARDRLRAIADLRVLDAVSQRSYLELASHYSEVGAFEQAEQLFQSSERLGADRKLSLAAQLGLCRVYGMANEGGFLPDGVVTERLRALESQHGDALIPPSFRAVAGYGVEDDSSHRVSDWVGDMRSHLSLRGPQATPDGASRGSPDASGGGNAAGLSSPAVQFTDEVVWSVVPPQHGDVARIVGFGPSRPDVLQDEVVVHHPGDEIAAYGARDGELLWKTTLRLPGDFADRQALRWREDEQGPRAAVADGQTGVFRGRDGLFAVGLGTGRRLWCRAFDPLEARSVPDSYRGAMAAADGVLAATPRAGRLSVLRLVDGSSVWERDLLGESVAHIWLKDDRVITADPRIERVHVFAKSDGRLVARILFDQPNPQHEQVGLILNNAMIFGPYREGDAQGVLAANLSNGQVEWRVALEKPIAQLFTPQEGYLGLGLLGGEVRIVDALTGRLEVARRVTGAQSIARGVLVDGTLVVQPHTSQAGVRSTALVALDVATDSELWRRDDVVPLWRLGRPLRIVNGRVPVLVQSQDARSRSRRNVNLAMLDIRTGLGDDVSVTLPATRRVAQLNGDFELLLEAGVALLGTDTGIRALRTVSADGAAQGGF